MTHPYTRIVFRVGDDDARKLAEGFSFFEAEDLKNLDRGQAICRVERSSFDFNLTVVPPEPVDETETVRRQEEVIARSRARYGTPTATVEALLLATLQAECARPEPAKPAKVKPSAPTPPEPSAAAAPEPVQTPPHIIPEPAAVSPVPEISRDPEKSPVIRDLGRGKAQHKAIQERLKSEAQKLGFLAQAEESVEKGANDRITDVLLKRDDVIIAVEIGLTTTTNHEFENIKKCLEKGVKQVAFVSTLPKRLIEMAAAIQGGLGSELAARVSCHSPDEFIEALKSLAAELDARPQPAPVPNETVVNGIRIRRHGPRLTREEQAERDRLADQVLASVLKSPGRRKK